MKPTVFLAACALIAGCTPVVNQRGYLQDLDVEASIDPVTDTKTTIQQRLGYPSTEATFTNDAWYYISSVEKQVAFFHPTVESRAILAVYFDKNGKVTDLKHYTLEDGHVGRLRDARRRRRAAANSPSCNSSSTPRRACRSPTPATPTPAAAAFRVAAAAVIRRPVGRRRSGGWCENLGSTSAFPLKSPPPHGAHIETLYRTATLQKR